MTKEMALAQAFLNILNSEPQYVQSIRQYGRYRDLTTRTLALRRLRVRAGGKP